MNENFQVPGKIKQEENKGGKGGKSKFRRSLRGGSRMGSEISIGRSVRSSKRSLHSKSGEPGKNSNTSDSRLGSGTMHNNRDGLKDMTSINNMGGINSSDVGGMFNMSKTTDDFDVSRISTEGRHTMASNKV